LIAINANDDKASPKDSFENMQKRAKGKNFLFAYVNDKRQEVIKSYCGSKTARAYLLKKKAAIMLSNTLVP